MELLFKKKQILNLKIDTILQDEDLQLLKKDNTITCLEIVDNYCTDETIDMVNKKLKQNVLQTLVFSTTRIFSTVTVQMKTIWNNSLVFKDNLSLKHLDLSDFKLSFSEFQSLELLLNRNKNLKTLKVKTGFDFEPDYKFSKLETNYTLKELVISNLEGKKLYEFLHLFPSLEKFEGTSIDLYEFMENVTYQTNPNLISFEAEVTHSIHDVDYSKTSIQDFTINYYNFSTFQKSDLSKEFSFIFKNMIHYSKLKSLKLMKFFAMDEIVEILKSNFIQSLGFNYTLSNKDAQILFKELETNISIQNLEVRINAEELFNLGDVIQKNHTLSSLILIPHIKSNEENDNFVYFFKSLQVNNGLSNLSLTDITFNNEITEIFCNFIKSKELISLTLDNCNFNEKSYQLFFESLENHSTIKSIKITKIFDTLFVLEPFSKMIKCNRSIEILKFYSIFSKYGLNDLINLSQALSINKTLKEIFLYLEEKEASLLRDGLFYNYSIKTVNFVYQGIHEVLHRNSHFIDNYYQNIPLKLQDLHFHF